MTTTAPVVFDHLYLSLGGVPYEALADGEVLQAGHETVEFTIALDSERERAFEMANLKPDSVPGYLVLLTAEQLESLRPSEIIRADVLDEAGDVVGRIHINGEAEAVLRTEHGNLAVTAIPFRDLRKGQFFVVSAKAESRRWLVYRALEDADPQTGKVKFGRTSSSFGVAAGKNWFELGPNYLCCLITDREALLDKLGFTDIFEA